jgi:single-stranded DNA-specific DHH superfamily exonuclease
MDVFEFSQILIRINELIESGNTDDAENLFFKVEEKLKHENSREELKRLDLFRKKIGDAKSKRSEIILPAKSDNELLLMISKGQKHQNETLISIEWYLKFFFWLAVIGLILIFLSVIISFGGR